MANDNSKGQSFTSALVGVKDSGSTKAIGALVNQNPELVAQVTKLLTPTRPKAFDSKGQQEVTMPRIDNVLQINQKIAQKTVDAKAIMQLFPDVRLAAEIMVVSTISPNDMFNQDINVVVPDNLYCGPLIDMLQPLVKEYMQKTYKLSEKLPEIFYKTMFETGSYPILIIPESSLDDIINGKSTFSRESAKGTDLFDDNFHLRQLGLLGAPDAVPGAGEFKALSAESFDKRERNLSYDRTEVRIDAESKVKSYVRAVDNPQVVKMNTFTSIAREAAINQSRKKNNRVGSIYSGLNEDALNDRELMGLLYQSTRRGVERLVKVKNQNEMTRFSVGRPLVLPLPPGSAVPVVASGNPQEHVGYFVPINAEGQPINLVRDYDSYGSLTKNQQFGSNKDLTSHLLSKTASYFGAKCDDLSLQQGARIFQDIVEADMLARLRNGVYGSEVEISSAPLVYQMMLFRALQQKETQLLFIPADMMVYFALDYNEDGTGKSLLEEIRTIASARAQSLLARVVGGIKNAVGRTKVNVEIDEKDSDRLGTFEMIKTEVLRQRSSIPTANSLAPNEIIAQNAMLAIEFETTGGPGLPSTKVGFSENNSNYTRPDTDLDDMLTEYVITGVGVPPELVAQAKQTEFATIADNNNLLMAKRTESTQKIFEPQLTKLLRTILMADGTFINEAKEVIKKNIAKVLETETTPQELKSFKDKPDQVVHLLLMEFLSNFELGLARPDVKSRQTQLENIELYEQTITKAMDAVMGPDCTDPAVVGEEAANKAKALYAAIKAAFIRREMRNTSFADEVLDIASEDERGNVLNDIMSEVTRHQQTVSKKILVVTKQTVPVAQATDLELSKLQTATPEVSGGNSLDGDGASPSSFGDGGGESGGGGGDLGGGLGDDLDLDIPMS